MLERLLDRMKRIASFDQLKRNNEDVSEKAYGQILDCIENDRPMFRQMIVYSMEELELKLACLGLEHVPDNIAPIVLLEFWNRLMPGLADNLRSSKSCFKLTDEQKQLFKTAYSAIVEKYSFQHIMNICNCVSKDPCTEDIWRKRIELSDRRLQFLDQVYEALGNSV